ncbi:Pro-Pol polyprotein [Echinococcus granulosus]|uniref:Pro-Pol polyprotein n=1 Tax=Echinococcus granulosus TaxID=6210 RepID=W6U727_ECHGR|nr:Pro-Pol polyprotein [Echinococcus granulosus]EUB54172.1 Pro-Pol polyprotein [Echinococcus granulosus]
MSNLDDLCAQLTQNPNDERKELRQLLLKYANIFSWQGSRLGRTNIVKHKIDTGETRPIWQPPKSIPPPWRGDVNHLVEEMLRDEVIKPSESSWAPPIASVKENDSKLQLCIDCGKLNASRNRRIGNTCPTWRGVTERNLSRSLRCRSGGEGVNVTKAED